MDSAFHVHRVADPRRFHLVDADNIVGRNCVVIAIGGPLDIIGNGFDICHVSCATLDQVPCFHCPVSTDCEGQLARWVDRQGCDTTLMRHQCLVTVPCPCVPDTDIAIITAAEQMTVFVEFQAVDRTYYRCSQYIFQEFLLRECIPVCCCK